MTDETKYLKSLERETVEYFHALLPDEHDREYLSDADIEEMWGEYSRSMFASWLCHDSLTADVALGMVRGWSAARYKRVDLENERDAAVQEIDRLRERLAAATRVTDEMVERAAEALYLRGDLSHWGTWEQEIWRYKETYYEDARAILAAALETQEGA
jgi:hypothetical protein